MKKIMCDPTNVYSKNELSIPMFLDIPDFDKINSDKNWRDRTQSKLAGEERLSFNTKRHADRGCQREK